MVKSFKSIEKYKDHVLLFARTILGLFFIFVHGLPKIMGGPDRWEGVGGALSNLGITFWPEGFGLIAALSEFIGGILLILGLWFRPATLFIMLTLKVASISKIASGGISSAAHPVEVLLFLMVLFAIGPGKYSIDKR